MALGASVLPLVIAGILVGVVGALAARGLGRAGLVVVGAVLTGLAAAAIVQGWLDVIRGSWVANAGVLTLTVLAIGAILAGLHAVLGRAGLILGAVAMIFVGNPFSGVGSAPELLPQPVGTIGQLMPPGAGGNLLRSTGFFDGAGGGGHLAVLAIWAIIGLLLLAAELLAPRRSAHGAVATPPPSGRSRRPSLAWRRILVFVSVPTGTLDVSAPAAPVLGFWIALLVEVGALSRPSRRTPTTPSTFRAPSRSARSTCWTRSSPVAAAPPRARVRRPGGTQARRAPVSRRRRADRRPRARVPQAVTTGEQFLEGFTPSRDRTIGFADLHFAVPVEDLKDSTKEALERVADPAREAGLTVEFSGGVVSTSEEETSVGEQIGVIVAFFVLLVSFGSVLIAGLPLITALIGVAIGLSSIYALTAVTELNSTAPTLATMLGLAVGIDYALFIVSRHRQQLADGLDPAESAARAVATAGSAVVFAVTVLIALVGLIVVGIPFLSVMGLAAAGTVAIAVLIALTLLPALLGFAGARAGRRRRPATGATAGLRWAQFVTRRPLVAIAGVIAVLVLVAIPALDIRQGLPDDSTKPEDTTERKSYELLTKGFGPGFAGP